MYIRHVRSVLKILVCTCVLGGPGVVLQATIPEAAPDQYHAIPERNAFGLRPPDAPPTLTNPPAPLPKITLTGITTILGNKRALMKVMPRGQKPGETNKEESLILTEGQRDGEVEVLQIDERAGSVKVNNSGTVMTLTFEKDGARLPSTPAPVAVPGVPTALPGTGALNPYQPAMNALKQGRAGRTPGFGATGRTAPPVGGVPTPTGLTPMQTNPAAQPANQELTAEEQAIINAFQHQENLNNPAYPPAQGVPSVPTGTPISPQPTGGVPAGVNLPGSTQVLVPQ